MTISHDGLCDTGANAHQGSTIVNSLIRALFTVGREAVSVVSFQMRPPLGWQHMKRIAWAWVQCSVCNTCGDSNTISFTHDPTCQKPTSN